MSPEGDRNRLQLIAFGLRQMRWREAPGEGRKSRRILAFFLFLSSRLRPWHSR